MIIVGYFAPNKYSYFIKIKEYLLKRLTFNSYVNKIIT